MTPSAPCRAAFSLYALTKTLINSSLVQKHRNIKLTVRKQEKKRHLSATLPCGFFPVRTVNNYTVVLRSKNAAIYTTNSR